MSEKRIFLRLYRRALTGTINRWNCCFLKLLRTLFPFRTANVEHAPFENSHFLGNGLNSFTGFDRRGTGNIGKQRSSVFCRILEMTIGFKK